MKNLILFSIGSAIVSILTVMTGCNSGDPPAAATSAMTTSAGGTIATPATATLLDAHGCTATAVGGGATINCGDGSSASITNGTNGTNGSNGGQGIQGAAGAQGVQGVTGPTGAANPYFIVEDGGNFPLGRFLIEIVHNSTYQPIGVTVGDRTANVIATYIYEGNASLNMSTETVYFSSTNCGGTMYVVLSHPTNMLFRNNGTVYKPNGNLAHPASTNSYRDYQGNCTNSVGGTYWWHLSPDVYVDTRFPAVTTPPMQILPSS